MSNQPENIQTEGGRAASSLALCSHPLLVVVCVVFMAVCASAVGEYATAAVSLILALAITVQTDTQIMLDRAIKLARENLEGWQHANKLAARSQSRAEELLGEAIAGLQKAKRENVPDQPRSP